MKRIRATLGAVMVAASLLPALAGSATAEDSAPAAVQPVYADYVQVDEPGTGAAGEKECKKPKKERVGAWVCTTIDDGRDLAKEEPKDRPARRAAPGDFTTEAITPSSEYCLTGGCWYSYSNTALATFDMRRAFFGFGTTTLGEVDGRSEWTQNGAQSVSDPIYFVATRPVSLTMEGERLKLTSSYPGGIRGRDNTYSIYGPVPTSSGVQARWSPNGYKAYTTDGTHQTVVHQFTWTVAGYSGRWYFYFKSQKLISSDFVTWKFSTPSNLPADPYKGAFTNYG